MGRLENLWRPLAGRDISAGNYAAANPEYYALVNGKRDAPGPGYDYKHRGQICSSNPAVVEIAANWVNAFFDSHPDYQAVHITLNDGGQPGFRACAAAASRQICGLDGLLGLPAASRANPHRSLRDSGIHAMER